MIEVRLPKKIAEVFFDASTGQWRPSRYKVLWGGRGGAKSESVARILVGKARTERCRILCTRMFQNSVEDSVYRTIVEAIQDMGLEHEFLIRAKYIRHRRTGTDFLFKGIQRDIQSIKSLKGVKYVWVEEAETVTQFAWQVLDPTIRLPGSEIFITFNPDLDNGATYRMFVVKPRVNSIVQEVHYFDNPFFPQVLEDLRAGAERQCRDEATGEEDPQARAAYEWIWLGKCRRMTDAVVFRSRWSVEDFDEPEGMRPFYGADWGFADDPSVLMRSYVLADNLFVTHEAFGYHTEIDDLPEMFDTIPGAREWPIKGDAAQPAIISYLRRKRFSISAAEKWPGSVEDGIATMKGFKHIYVHPRCANFAREMRLYSWKIDPKQLDENDNPVILPVLIDKFNHGIDAVRYSLDGHIKGRGNIEFSADMLDSI